MIDYLRATHKIPTTISGRAVGMDKFKLHNIRRGGSSVALEDVINLVKAFPVLESIATDHGIVVADLTTVEEPESLYTKSDPVLMALLRIEKSQSELLKHLVERSTQDAETINKLIDIIKHQTNEK